MSLRHRLGLDADPMRRPVDRLESGVLALLALTAAGDTLGLGKAWSRLPLVQRLPWLR